MATGPSTPGCPWERSMSYWLATGDGAGGMLSMNNMRRG
jgi:hypothetical protein